MSAQPVFLTREGYHSLEQELNHLSTVRRRELAEQFRQALPEGDMLENAGLQDAYDQYAFLEGRIQQLECMLLDAVIIQEDPAPKDCVGLGCRVTLMEEGEHEHETFTIVGAPEADPSNGRISKPRAGRRPRARGFPPPSG